MVWVCRLIETCCFKIDRAVKTWTTLSPSLPIPVRRIFRVLRVNKFWTKEMIWSRVDINFFLALVHQRLPKLNKFHCLGDASKACSNDNIPSSPDFSKLDFDSYNELLDKLNPDANQITPKKTDMFGFPLAPILPYFMMEPNHKCPPGKFLVCCRISDTITIGLPRLCTRCEWSQRFFPPWFPFWPPLSLLFSLLFCSIETDRHVFCVSDSAFKCWWDWNFCCRDINEVSRYSFFLVFLLIQVSSRMNLIEANFQMSPCT